MEPRVVRASRLFLPTLKDAPADATTASHRLLVRAGFVRQVGPGLYAFLPLGARSLGRLMAIAREELAAAGAEEFRLPAVGPTDGAAGSGRGEAADLPVDERRAPERSLGSGSVAAFASLAQGEVRSYRQLPRLWFAVQAAVRDEERPRPGPLWARESVVVATCSLDLDSAGLDRAFEEQKQLVGRVLARCGLDAQMVEADQAGASIRFVVRTDAGDEQVAACPACGYAATVEVATSRLPNVADELATGPPERFPTPGVTTIQALASPPYGVPPERQLKTLVYVADERPVVAVVRGDHALDERRLRAALGVGEVRPAAVDEVVAAMGAHPGSLGAVAFRGAKVLVDRALVGRTGMVTGANQDGFHFRGVDVARDLLAYGAEVADLRTVEAGEGCPRCDGALEVFGAVTVGALSKVGTSVSEALGATVLDVEGRETPIAMGSYQIDLGRVLAAVVEQRHDAEGIVWPPAVAPFDATVLTLGGEPELVEVAERVCEALGRAGLEVLYDDRDERAGVKFKDADLVGIPVRIAVGRKGLASGGVEWKRRGAGEVSPVPVAEVAERTLVALREVSSADG